MSTPKHSRVGTRLNLLDSLRGLCVISMVIYHAMYDLVNIRGVSAPWYNATPGYIWQQSICCTFILLSGFCWGLSKKHVKRGLLLTVCGAAITLVTYIAMPSELILYGILTLLGLSALLLDLLNIAANKLCISIPAQAGLAAAIILFFLTRGIPQGYLGFEGLHLTELPQALYRFEFLAPLGLPAPGFYSSDYFPLIPWFFLYLAGYFLWKLVCKSESTINFLRADGIRPLNFVGRHSLLIYLAHQPILMGIFMLLDIIG